jgi:hypothetical protein
MGFEDGALFLPGVSTGVAVGQSTNIPEPSTLALVAIALVAGFGVSRTRAVKFQPVPA